MVNGSDIVNTMDGRAEAREAISLDHSQFTIDHSPSGGAA
jgi:hypothetical protein